MAAIKFIQLKQQKYNSLTEKLATNIYFTTDTRRIYKGQVLYTQKFQIVTAVPTTTTAQQDVLYILPATGDMYILVENEIENEIKKEIKQVGGNSEKITEIEGSISANSNNISSLDGRITTVESDLNTDSTGIKARLTAAQDAIEALGAVDGGSIADALVKKLDVTTFNSYSSETDDTLSSLRSDVDANEGAISSNASEIAGIKTSLVTLEENSAVSVEVAETATTGYLKTYVIKQGGVEAAVKIDIPKDLVVSSGSVVKGTWTQGIFTEGANGAGTALKLVIANHEDQPVYINTLDLVKDHTGSTVDGITVTISDTNVISVSVADGSITKAKLHSDVQASLDKADSALQSGATYYTDIKVSDAEGASTLAVDMNGVKGRIDALETFQSSSNAIIDGRIDAKIALLDSSATAATGKFINSITMVGGKITAFGEGDLPTYTMSSGSANGTVSFNGQDVVVTGLGSAAFAETTAFDAAGAAAAVLGTSNDETVAMTVNGLSKRIDILNSTDATQAGSVAYQVAQASSSAVAAANSYTDAALAWESYDENGNLIIE